MRSIRVLLIAVAALSLSAFDIDPEFEWLFGPGVPGFPLPNGASPPSDGESNAQSDIAASASFSVGWIPPTTNTDGSVLTDLAAYEIHYGTQSGRYTKSVRIDNVGLTRYVVTGVDLDTYFVAMRAVNRAGVVSDFSTEVARLAN